ncbi:hypothetical protein Goari_025171, partial [Gossypium aridum]|nr:hypothetical protein [Gossypium aridum]
MVLCKEIWSLVWYHRWEHFCITLKENNAVIPLIQEFYAALKDEDTRRPYSVRRNTITVK